MAKTIVSQASGGEINSVVQLLADDLSETILAQVVISSAAVNRPTQYPAVFGDDLPAGVYFLQHLASDGWVMSTGYVVIGASAGIYRVIGRAQLMRYVDGFSTEEISDIAAALEAYFETDTPMKGSLSVLSVIELVAAALLGRSSAPTATTEKFVHLDGVTDAFTVTFDTDNYRSSVSVE